MKYKIISKYGDYFCYRKMWWFPFWHEIGGGCGTLELAKKQIITHHLGGIWEITGKEIVAQYKLDNLAGRE